MSSDSKPECFNIFNNKILQSELTWWPNTWYQKKKHTDKSEHTVFKSLKDAFLGKKDKTSQEHTTHITLYTHLLNDKMV